MSSAEYATSSTYWPTPPGSGWVIDLDQGCAVFKPGPVESILSAQPDLGPSHIRSIAELHIGQTVNLIVMTKDYQGDDLCHVSAIEAGKDQSPGATRIKLSSLVAFDHNDLPTEDFHQSIRADDLGLAPYIDKDGTPYRWTQSTALFSIDT